jgi:hypothetical protein
VTVFNINIVLLETDRNIHKNIITIYNRNIQNKIKDILIRSLFHSLLKHLITQIERILYYIYTTETEVTKYPIE